MLLDVGRATGNFDGFSARQCETITIGCRNEATRWADFFGSTACHSHLNLVAIFRNGQNNIGGNPCS